ncbi:MAG TPA: hypothetical protein VNG71_00935 [Pyrinomonadaceae bacterium]|nr:hypothetical protein [Pyrinomonadaceae bacterium]
MKSFIALASFLVLVSLACSASKSAGSERAVNQNAEIQSTSTPTPPNPNQENTNREKEPCTLKLAGAPTVNGVRLGMSTEELLALFPGSNDDPEVRASTSGVTRFGTASVVLTPERYQLKEKFPGISQTTVRLIDGRVFEYTVNYTGPAYSHVDKFVAKFIEGTTLPAADQWDAYVGMDNQMKTLTCAEFEVRAFAAGQGGSLNYVVVKDLIADKAFRDRRAKARAQASPTP